MNCEKCGNQIKENNKFCQVCGTPVANNAATNPTPQKSAPRNTTPPKPKKEVDEKTKKKRKLLTILAVIILIAGFATYKVGESMTSKDNVLEKFITAITEKDIPELAKLVKSSDPRLEINEENLKPFLDYIDENPSYFDRLTTSIMEQSENQNQQMRNNNKSMPAFSKDEDTNIISLKKKGKKFVFYDNYQLEMQPFFVRISTNYKDAIISINGKEIGVADSENFSKEFGPFAPGRYTIKSSYTGEYTTIENETAIDLITDYYDSNSKVSRYDLYLDGRYVYADTNHYDGNIFINGKDSGLTAMEMNEIGLGPVDDSTAIYLSKDFPWGNITSEEVTVGESGSYLSLYLDPINITVQDQIMEAINIFVNDNIQAKNARDASKYTNIDKEFQTRLEDNFNNKIAWEEVFTGKAKGMLYDLDTLKLYHESTEYHSSIKGQFVYEGVNYYEGYETPELVETTENMQYNLKYDEKDKKWIIYRTDHQYYFDGYNIKEYSFGK